MSCSRTQRSDAGEASRSQVKHSTTEPLRSLEDMNGIRDNNPYMKGRGGLPLDINV